ncbi:MAG: plasmid recombination protein [Candidatus Coprovivens sp.]
MFDGYQVLTITNKIKSSDIGGLSKELTNRIGTGNYDKERTKYNIEFVPLCSSDLASSTYKNLYKNNIEFNKNNKKINLLNGCVITSGQEFFKSLGMKFEDTGEFHTEGKHKGEPIQKALIKSKEDIPEKVLEYFNCSNEFMCNLVGKENVIYSAIHFDENTPHMHFYFTPVVHEVKRKVFETDKDGHQILKPYITKDGIEKMIPIQKKDENGKNVYEIEYGNFLNSDQFWKEKGFKTSYAKIQDDYNKFINEKGFNLDRGEVGANKHHLTKAEKQLKDLQEQNKLLEIELIKNKALNNTELKYMDKISDVDTNPLLNPEKGKIIGYKEKDITNLSNYSKQITKDNLNKDKIIEQNEIKLESKQKQIDKLNTEIKKLKSGKTIKEKDKIIENQKLIIKEKDETINFQNTIISSLRNELTELKENIDTIINSVKNVAIDLYKALKRTLGFDVDKNQEYDSYSFKSLSKKINKKYEKDKSDDYEL